MSLLPFYFFFCLFFFNDTATTEIYTLSLHDALPRLRVGAPSRDLAARRLRPVDFDDPGVPFSPGTRDRALRRMLGPDDAELGTNAPRGITVNVIAPGLIEMDSRIG